MTAYRNASLIAGVASAALIAGAAQAAVRIDGRVEIAHAPVAGSNVTLWSASPGAPAKIGSAVSGPDGGFTITAADTPAAPTTISSPRAGPRRSPPHGPTRPWPCSRCWARARRRTWWSTN